MLTDVVMKLNLTALRVDVMRVMRPVLRNKCNLRRARATAFICPSRLRGSLEGS